MTPSCPQRTRIYASSNSASAIWARFALRPDDVFICTPPKSGTTWMQSICAMLIFGDPQVNPGNGTVSRWLDSASNDEAELLHCLHAQAHRRYIKTHTPLDGITHDPACTYITVYRHPLDVAFSSRNHMKNKKTAAPGDLVDDMNHVARHWIESPFSPDQTIGASLESVVHHFTSFRAWHDLPNIHFFHYEDMKRDLGATVARLAEILGYGVDTSLVDAIAQAATFANMKANAAKYAPSADRGIWKDNAQFFESASSNKWDGVLSRDVLDLYSARMDELLANADRAWLEHGSV